MEQISKEAYKKGEVEIIDKGRYFWINGRNLEAESDVANWAQIFYKFNPEKQKYRHELMPNTIFQSSRRFVQNDLVERKIKSCRKASEKFLKFKEKLGLDPYAVTCDEQDIISALQIAFEGEIIHTQYCIKNKRLDAYFPKHKLGIEVDEYNHEGRNFEYEQSRQFMIESHGITIIRTNPDDANFNMNRLINQIYTHIIKSIKKQTNASAKKSLIDNLSKRLLNLIKSKCLKWIVKNILPDYKK